MSDENIIYYESEDTKFNTKYEDPDKQVKTYNVNNEMEYPYLMLESDIIPGFKAQVIANTLEKKKYIQDKTPEGYYNVYLQSQGVIVGLGMIHSHALKNILISDLYKDMNKYMVLSPTEQIDGDMMYSYCTSPLY